ncbi:MAG: GAF domain-containing protein [Sulfuricurvum sp.]|uniref:GAF domain-containing protein n=1 Tax=Sulfuricurvum sp. TaxID=2025608 RepID=UPI0026182894|nr:GAF domain-containing protein [Sulfuricurvum sp.]MDD5158949.1 GAF domain-containing protein [Sulfuricurvum sp.]
MIDKLLTTCDQEPIHILSRIQQSGFVFVVSYEDFSVLQVSDNCIDLIHCDPDFILNRPLQNFFDDLFMQRIKDNVTLRFFEKRHFKAFSAVNNSKKLFCAVHCEERFIILEISVENSALDMSTEMMFTRAVSYDNPQLPLIDLLHSIASTVQDISDFDRVLIYKFDEDNNGTVLAQVEKTFSENFLGHHFPASDIPVQARALYLKNRFRIIENVEESSAVLIPTINPLTNTPLDMTFCYSRSVSPIHLQYLKNMGVNSSMSISLIIQNKLWGLVVCHHPSPKKIPYGLYESYSLLSTVFSSQIEQKEHLIRYQESSELRLKRELFLNSLGSKSDLTFVSALTEEIAVLETVLPCDIAAVYYEEDFIASNAKVPGSELFDLLRIIKNNFNGQCFQTSRLGIEFPQVAHFSIPLGGIIAIEISNINNAYLMFIRFEQISTIEWAGEPTKQFNTEKGISVINPRASFESWKEIVTGTSLPFSSEELDSARQLSEDLYRVYNQCRVSEETRQLKALHTQLFELIECNPEEM